MIAEEDYMDILSLKRQGYSDRHIARKTGLDRRTVGKYLKGQKTPGYNKMKRTSILEQYKPLIEGWLRQDDYKATRIYVPKAVTVTYLSLYLYLSYLSLMWVSLKALRV